MELLELADRLVGWARAGEQLEAFVVRSAETEVRAYDGSVESLSSAVTEGVGIRIVHDQRQGFAYAGTFEASALEQAVADARDNATFGSPDRHVGLVAPDGVDPARLALFRDDLAAVSTERKVELALELERATRAADRRVVGIESAEYADTATEAAIASTAGVRSLSRETGCYLSASVLASDGTETKSGFGFSVGRHPDDLDLDVAATDAVHRATRLLGARKPPTSRLTVLLDPFVTAQFLSIVGSTLTGDAVLKGRSPFADRLDQEVAASAITLVDDPTNPAAFTASMYDAEGVATRRNVLIGGGRLAGFVHDGYSARRMGAAPTASAVRGGYKSTPTSGVQALALDPGTATQPELIEGIDDGLLVQVVSGLHSGVNPVSGDFSTGVEGLRIRDGALAEPVREATMASTIQRMLGDVIAVGGDVEWLPMSAAGVSLVIGDIMMSGS